ncbi:MAG: AMP-binding protein [Firmicutes bacterium]|nr:AMP-binding protein [Bacillota bacterium]
MAVGTLPGALLNVVQKSPDAPAVYYFDTSWSYRQLLERVQHLSGFFRQHGVKSGDRIAVMLQNMPASLAVQFAVWTLGAVVVPINIMYQPQEISYQLRDAQVSGIVILQSVASRLNSVPEAWHLPVIVVVKDDQDLLGEPPSWLPISVPAQDIAYPYHPYEEALLAEILPSDQWTGGAPSDLCYLSYTSGTTGTSKGAMNTHGQVLHNARVYEKGAQLSSHDVVMAFAPLFHITGAVAALATAVWLGSPLVLFYRFDPVVACKGIERHRGTFTVGAITTYLSILEHINPEEYDLSSFHKAYSGGAPVSSAVVDRFESRFHQYIYNVYGLTESANGLILTPWTQRAPVDRGSGALSVGLPGQGIEVEIRDLNNPAQRLPAGQEGELALKGPSITQGYWNRPDATRESIVDGWFFTGDVALCDEAGWVYIVDRKKDMIITAGNKVWPRDVEDALYLHPAVKEAVVVGLPDAYRGEAVTAFVVRSDETLTETALKDFLRIRLAAYKIPRTIQWVDEIPKTATGKSLRRHFREAP